MGQSISLKKTAGFTLLELLMVIAILSIVTFVSIGKISDTTDEERFQKTIQQMKEIRNAMIGNPDLKTGSHRNSFGYLGDIGQIPSAGQGIGALITNPGFPAWALSSITRIGMGWNGPYLSASDSGVNYLKDAWGTPYVYSPGTTPPTLVSLGADRVVGGSGMNADITLLLPSTLTQATLHGVILNGGTQWAQDAEIELNFPNGAGVLAQTLQAVAPADLGAFTVATVPMGIRSITLYFPNKAGALATTGPFVTPIDQPDTLALLDVGKAHDTGLIARFHLDESTAGTAPAGLDFNDASGNGNNGAQVGTVTYGAAGKINRASSFAGAGAISIPDTATLELANAFTLSAWVSPTNFASIAQVISKSPPATHFAWQMGINNSGNVTVDLSSNGTLNHSLVSAGTLTAGTWNHIATTWDGTTVKIYINGTIDASTLAFAGPIFGAAEEVAIARESGNNSQLFNGKIDEVAIWNRALSASEVAELGPLFYP